jgi:thiamine-phosphate pyrophosphorylase
MRKPSLIIAPFMKTGCEDYTFGMIRYAITAGGGGDWPAQARRWAEMGVEYVQLREKKLAAGEMGRVARLMREVFAEAGGTTKLLVNGRADVALVAGADGVHLTAAEGELTPEQVRRVFATAGGGVPVVSVSCHTLDDVRRAVRGGVDLILFGPVFEKRVAGEVVVAGVGREALRRACEAAGGVAVLALGGVTDGNWGDCLEAGAAGVAGIRMFG